MDSFVDISLAAVAAAGVKLREAWGKPKTIEYKGPVDLVTDTDRAVEEMVTTHLLQAFPDHIVVGEESAGALVPAPADRYVWYLDPVDGTTNFAHGYPQFCVSLALVHGGQIQLGIVHDPTRDETFVARLGGGATLNGQSIHVSTTRDLNHALLGTGFPYDRRERSDFYLAFMKDFMRASQGIRRAGSAALDLCYVACGRLDGFWEWKLKPWDIAAGALIVGEAGGQTSNFHGAPLDLLGEQTLASNGHLHPSLLAILASGV